MSKNHDLPPIGESGELLAKRETLIVGAFCSVCGNCGENADPGEAKHEMIQTIGNIGCGVEFKYITGEDGVTRTIAANIRPDLVWADFDPSLDGITPYMEEKLIFDIVTHNAFPFEAEN